MKIIIVLCTILAVAGVLSGDGNRKIYAVDELEVLSELKGFTIIVDHLSRVGKGVKALEAIATDSFSNSQLPVISREKAKTVAGNAVVWIRLKEYGNVTIMRLSLNETVTLKRELNAEVIGAETFHEEVAAASDDPEACTDAYTALLNRFIQKYRSAQSTR